MKKKAVFIGNSIVAGYPWSRSKSFVSLLRREPDFNIINKGVNGDTTAGILARFPEDVISAAPDAVFIMSGTNDFVYRDATPQEAFGNLEKMARMCREAGAEPVFITPLPVDTTMAESMWLVGMGVSYAAVNRDLETLSQLIRDSGEAFVDMNRRFAEYRDSVGDPELVYVDGLHPMPEGHSFIAGYVKKFMEEHFLADKKG